MDLDPQPVGRHPRGRGLLLRHQGGHGQREPRLVVSRDRHRFARLRAGGTSTARMDKYAQCWICGASQLRGVPVLSIPATPENSPHGNLVPCDPQGNPVITNAKRSAPQGMAGERSAPGGFKVELTFANMAAVGCQPSVQTPDLFSGGKLAVGSVGGDALGAYSKSK